MHFSPEGADYVSAWLVPQLRDLLAGSLTTAVEAEQFDTRKLQPR